jgi:hypothetical protein
LVRNRRSIPTAGSRPIASIAVLTGRLSARRKAGTEENSALPYLRSPTDRAHWAQSLVTGTTISPINNNDINIKYSDTQIINYLIK